MDDAKRQGRNARSAKTVLQLFNERLDIVVSEATKGDNQASLKVMQLLADRDWTLRQLGYETGDTGRLRKYRKPTTKEQVLIDLSIKAMAGDAAAAIKLMQVMSGNNYNSPIKE